MKIKELNEVDFERYEKIAICNGTVFNRLDWLNIFGKQVQIWGIYDNGDNIIGGFHLYKENKLGLIYYHNPPFTPTIGPFIQIKAKTPVIAMNKWKEIISLIVDFLEKLPYSVISISLSKDIYDTQPFIWKKYKVSPGYTYIINLEKPVEEIKQNMFTRRRNITKALSDDITVKYNEDLEIVRTLVLKTFLRQNKKINTFHLDNILYQFANKENSFNFVSYCNDKPSSASFYIYDQKTVYYILSGYDEKNSHSGAGSLVMWEAIQFAKKLGKKYFDFEGSMIPQIEIFLRGFGGVLTPYYRVNKALLPLEILLKFYRRELF